MSRIQANLLLLLAAAIWGGGFVSQATAMKEIGPYLFVGLRFGVACLVILPFAIWESRRVTRPMTARNRTGFVLVGLSLLAGALTQQAGLLTTSVTNSGFLTGLYVLFVPLMSLFVLARPPHPVIWPAAFMALAGIFLLSGGDLSALTRGDLLTVLCAFFWAVQVLLVGIHATESGRPLLMSCVQSAICSMGGFALAFSLETNTLAALPAVLPEVLYSGILSSGLAFTLQIVAQRHTTSPQAALFLSSEALFAALAGALLLGERIAPAGYAGGLLLVLAMLAVEVVPELNKRKSMTS